MKDTVIVKQFNHLVKFRDKSLAKYCAVFIRLSHHWGCSEHFYIFSSGLYGLYKYCSCKYEALVDIQVVDGTDVEKSYAFCLCLSLLHVTEWSHTSFTVCLCIHAYSSGRTRSDYTHTWIVFYSTEGSQHNTFDIVVGLKVHALDLLLNILIIKYISYSLLFHYCL